jgi:CSLREA domain-containing protein
MNLQVQSQHFTHVRTAETAARLFILATLILLLAVTTWPANMARAANITVNTTADENNNDGDCSLREAIRAANLDQAVDACPAGNGPDTIHLPPGDYLLALSGAGESTAQTGDLDITGELTILGAGKEDTTVDAAGLDRVFEIHSPAVHISGVTITGGDPGIPSGGGIRVEAGTLTLSNSWVRDNIDRAGIYVAAGAMATVMNTHVDGNHNDNSGGGISIAGTLHLKNSLVSGNTADDNAGGIYNNTGTLLVVNSTISGNNANIHAGGILNSNTAVLINTTIAGNTADANADDIGHAGGVYNNNSAGAVLTIRNTIIGDNVDNSAVTIISDCSGTLISEGYNLIENLTGCALSGTPDGNITGASPGLGPLQFNGGAMPSHGLLAGSPAIDAGNPGGCLDESSTALTDDQRGFIRPADGDGDGDTFCDIGAF